jgi:hypothetical protein
MLFHQTGFAVSFRSRRTAGEFRKVTILLRDFSVRRNADQGFATQRRDDAGEETEKEGPTLAAAFAIRATES